MRDKEAVRLIKGITAVDELEGVRQRCRTQPIRHPGAAAEALASQVHPVKQEVALRRLIQALARALEEDLRAVLAILLVGELG